MRRHPKDDEVPAGIAAADRIIAEVAAVEEAVAKLRRVIEEDTGLARPDS